MRSIFNKSNFAIIFFIASLILVVGLLFIRYFAMIDTTKTCGRIIGDDRIKGHRTFEVLYFVNGTVKKAHVSSQAFKVKDLNILTDINCLEIEYSNYLSSYISITDTIVGSGQGW